MDTGKSNNVCLSPSFPATTPRSTASSPGSMKFLQTQGGSWVQSLAD